MPTPVESPSGLLSPIPLMAGVTPGVQNAATNTPAGDNANPLNPYAGAPTGNFDYPTLMAYLQAQLPDLAARLGPRIQNQGAAAGPHAEFVRRYMTHPNVPAWGAAGTAPGTTPGTPAPTTGGADPFRQAFPNRQAFKTAFPTMEAFRAQVPNEQAFQTQYPGSRMPQFGKFNPYQS